MIIIPAIDLLDRRCVRLYKGSYDRVTEYDTDPIDTARRYQADGAVRIHVVDLNGAKGNGSVNRPVIRDIRKSVTCVLEVGGGIRTDDDVEELIDLGADRLVVGSVLVKDPEKVRSWVYKYGPRFIAGIDALMGLVKISGWRESGEIRDEELAFKSKDYGLVSIIYTNIAMDGTLAGPALEDTLRIAYASGLPVILSGGIGSEKDVASVCEHEKAGITGIIVGKALYEGAVAFPHLVAKYQSGTENMTW